MNLIYLSEPHVRLSGLSHAMGNYLDNIVFENNIAESGQAFPLYLDPTGWKANSDTYKAIVWINEHHIFSSDTERIWVEVDL